VRPDLVVVVPPLLDDYLGFFQAVEDLSVEEPTALAKRAPLNPQLCLRIMSSSSLIC